MRSSPPVSIRASTSRPFTRIRTQGSSHVVVWVKESSTSVSPPHSMRYGSSSPNDFISSQSGRSTAIAEAGEEACGRLVPVGLQVDEREGDLGVDPGVDIAARVLHHPAQERLRSLVVAEEVLELGQPAHDFERWVALRHDLGRQLPRPGEVTGRVRGLGFLDPRIDPPAEALQLEVDTTARPRASSRSASWPSIQRPMSCSRTWATIASRRRRRSAGSMTSAS